MENQYFSSLFTSRIEVPRINKTYFCPLMSFKRREYRNQLQRCLQDRSRTVIFEISSTSGPKSCPQKKKVLYIYIYIYIIISFFNGPLWTRSLRKNSKIALIVPDWVFIWSALAVHVIKNIRKHTTGGVELHYGPFAWRKIMYFDHFCTLKSDFFLKWCPKCIKTFPDAILNGANRFSVKNRI